MENLNNKINAFAKAYSHLFNEDFKALMLVLYQLHKKTVCTWNDLFEGSGLKRMGASTGTVSRLLKALEKSGWIRKEKAPFPFKVKYVLIQRHPAIDTHIKLLDKIHVSFTQQKIEELLEFLPCIIQAFLISMAKALKEGESNHLALLGFLLTDYMTHLALHLPSELELEIFNKLKLIEEASSLQRLQEKVIFK